MWTSKKEATARIDELEAELKQAKAELESADIQNSKLVETINGYNSKIDEFGKALAAVQESCDSITAKNESLEAKLAKQEEDIAAREKNLKSEAAKLAQEMVASNVLPHGMINSGSDNQSTNGKLVVEQFQAITDPVEKNRFYKEHKDELNKVAFKR